MNVKFTSCYVIFFIITFLIRNHIRSVTLKAEKLRGKIMGSWTTKYIFFVYLILLFGSFMEYFVVRRNINYIVSISGLILYCSGLFGRQWAFKSLGKYWSVDIEIRENHEIVQKGPYMFMRHPNSLFHIFEVFGLCIIPNSWYSAAFAVLFYVPIILLRSSLEEKHMREQLTDRYENYVKQTWGYLPFPRKGFYV